jgi:hypothetical protein
MVDDGDTCPQCGHAFDPHTLLAVDPRLGGIVLCPVKGCQCYSTFSVNEHAASALPDRWEVEALRERLQNEGIH